MNEIVKVYKNSPVRIVEKGGEPWFVARDVCKVLEITKVDSAIRNLDADENGAHRRDILPRCSLVCLYYKKHGGKLQGRSTVGEKNSSKKGKNG